MAAPIREEDLLHRAKLKEVVTWNRDKGMVTAMLEKRVGNVLLSARPLAKIPEDLRIRILCDALRKKD